MESGERELIKKELDKYYRWYDIGTRMWSTLHHTTLWTSALLTGAVTVLVATKWGGATAQIILATMATMLTSFSSSGGFAGKWQANRRSRGRIEQLRIELMASTPDLDRMRNQLVEVIQKHDEGIISAETVGDQHKPDQKDKG